MRKAKKIFHNKSIRCFIVGLSYGALSSCAPALPIGNPESAVTQSTREAQAAAVRSRTFADESLAQLELSEKLLKEAQGLLKEARKVELHCSEVLKKIPKRRPVVCKSSNKTSKKKTDKKQNGGVGVLYSPSDAP